MKRIILMLLVILGMIINSEVQGSYSLKQGEGNAEETAISSKGFFAERAGDLFSMDIKDVALEEVLTRISRENGITFLLPPSLAEEKVMVRFSNLKLDQGLGKILQHYNSIFIYFEETNLSSESSVTRLTEVRIYALSYKGRVVEAPLIIMPGSSPHMVKVKVAEKKRGEELEEKEEGSIEGLSLALRDKDSRVRMEAVKALAKMDEERAIGPLALALKDQDQGVKKEAEKVLKEMEESLKKLSKEREELEKELEGDEPQNDVPEGEEEPTKGGQSTLTLGASSGNAAQVELNNEVSVRGVQFTLKGVKAIEVRTTSRSEGFFAQFNKDNGTVLLLSLSGSKIAPGTGPIAEIIYNNTGSASLTGVKIVE